MVIEFGLRTAFGDELRHAIERGQEIRERLLHRFSGAEVAVHPNPAPAGPAGLMLGAGWARIIAEFLREKFADIAGRKILVPYLPRRARVLMRAALPFMARKMPATLGTRVADLRLPLVRTFLRLALHRPIGG